MNRRSFLSLFALVPLAPLIAAERPPRVYSWKLNDRDMAEVYRRATESLHRREYVLPEQLAAEIKALTADNLQRSITIKRMCPDFQIEMGNLADVLRRHKFRFG